MKERDEGERMDKKEEGGGEKRGEEKEKGREEKEKGREEEEGERETEQKANNEESNQLRYEAVTQARA